MSFNWLGANTTFGTVTSPDGTAVVATGDEAVAIVVATGVGAIGTEAGAGIAGAATGAGATGTGAAAGFTEAAATVGVGTLGTAAGTAGTIRGGMTTPPGLAGAGVVLSLGFTKSGIT